jgi:hypothetical protein
MHARGHRSADRASVPPARAPDALSRQGTGRECRAPPSAPTAKADSSLTVPFQRRYPGRAGRFGVAVRARGLSDLNLPIGTQAGRPQATNDAPGQLHMRRRIGDLLSRAENIVPSAVAPRPRCGPCMPRSTKDAPPRSTPGRLGGGAGSVLASSWPPFLIDCSPGAAARPLDKQ